MSDEQRREPGCIARRMQRDCHHGLLEPRTDRPPAPTSLSVLEDVVVSSYFPERNY